MRINSGKNLCVCVCVYLRSKWKCLWVLGMFSYNLDFLFYWLDTNINEKTGTALKPLKN